jgi:[phosphatase 2A protein]-leucine-carboxy methyltransferase
MIQIYHSLPPFERQRIEKIEMLDETELLTQLMQHYCISIAWMGELFQDIELT